jgi:Uma2 family endonuclease
MTFEEFEALPDPPGGYYELHHGELVTLTFPILAHSVVQRNLRRLLEPFAAPDSFIDKDVPFRPHPEHEYREADVAWLCAERFRLADRGRYIEGAPDLVIEVLSPSNTAAEMLDKEQICLANGSREFWVVDPKRRRIKVTTGDGRTATYGPGQRVPVNFSGSEGEISIDAVFDY